MIKFSLVLFAFPLLSYWNSCSKYDSPVNDSPKLKKTSLAAGWSFTLGDRSVLSQSSFPPSDSGYYTDGAISVEGGQQIQLYYAFDFRPDGRRTLASRTITFELL